MHGNQSHSSTAGRVYLVGAGPGDPGLLTMKGADCLRRADCVVYDYLANPVLLELAPPETERSYVGKKAGCHSMPQEEICALLVEKGRSGKTVVRLKGGDPFVFGRGGEEAVALAEAGVPFDVVPGVTAAVAAGAYAGIPVTDRSCNSVLSLVTGHEDPTKPESRVDWASLARGGGTLAFYMGVGKLPLIAAELQKHGRPADTPVALVRCGTTPNQATVVGTLADIADKVKEAGLKPPAMILVGDVVNLRKRIAWFEQLPLFGKTIAITRPVPQLAAMETRLRELGADVLRFPTIAIAPMPDPAPLQQALRTLANGRSGTKYESRSNAEACPGGSHPACPSGNPAPDWVIFTSPNAVSYVFQTLCDLKLDARAFSSTRIAAIGSGTAAELARHGLVPDLVPDTFTSAALLDALRDAGEIAGNRFLLPRADIAPDALPNGLRDAGATDVVEVAAYRTVPGAPSDEAFDALRDGTVDAVTFTSSSTAANFADLCRERLGDVPLAPAFVSIGPETSRKLTALGLEVAAEATTHTPDGVVDALIDFYGDQT